MFTAPFVYDNTGYAVIALLIIAIYGWLMERRHGPGAGRCARADRRCRWDGGGRSLLWQEAPLYYLGGNGAALALLCAWVVPDLTLLLRKRDYEGDLLGTAVLAGVMVLMPLADAERQLGGGRRRRGCRAGARLAADAHPSTEARPRLPNLRSCDRSELLGRRNRRRDRCAVSEPGRLDGAQALVTRAAPSLERVLGSALHEGGWFDTAHNAAVKDAVGTERPA